MVSVENKCGNAKKNMATGKNVKGVKGVKGVNWKKAKEESKKIKGKPSIVMKDVEEKESTDDKKTIMRPARKESNCSFASTNVDPFLPASFLSDISDSTSTSITLNSSQLDSTIEEKYPLSAHYMNSKPSTKIERIKRIQSFLKKTRK